HSSQETGHEAHRKVNVADNQNQGHTDGQNGHVARLVHQVHQVAGGNEQPIGGDGKHHEDYRQGYIHGVIANVADEQGTDLGPQTPPYSSFIDFGRVHALTPSVVFVASAMIFSSVASLASSSPVMVPSDMM